MELSDERIELAIESDARMSGFDEILGHHVGVPSERHKSLGDRAEHRAR